MSEQSKWLSAPPSAQTVRMRLIEEIGEMSLPSTLFLDPISEGHEVLSGPSMAFLIENQALGKMALFDLGIRKDWWNIPPKVRDLLAFCVGFKVEKDVPEVLRDAGISLRDIDDIIWSHSHLDHRGDASLFPPSTTLHYGKEVAALNPEATGAAQALFLASDFAGRHNNKVDFSNSTFEIGGFPALDFYGDGSFFLLDTPGHDHADSVGLAGVETPKTLLLRHPRFPPSSGANKSLDEAARTTPWYGVARGQLSTFIDPVTGQSTADRLREAFDEAENVFVALAHDSSLLTTLNGMPLLPTLNKAPQQDLNGWYEAGWKHRLYWTWVNQLGTTDGDGKVQPQEPLVVGFWMHGKMYGTLQEVIERS